MGEKLGVTNKTVSRWETGTYMPPVDILLRMSELYNVSVNEILSGERLDTRGYQIKAEENVVSTLKRSQKDSRIKRIAIVCCSVALVILFALLGLYLFFIGLFPHNSEKFFDGDNLATHLVSDLPKPKNKIVKDYGSTAYISMTEREFELYVESVCEYLLSCNFQRLGTRGGLLSGLIGVQYYVNTDVSELSDFYSATAEAGGRPFNGYVFVWANPTPTHYLEIKYLYDTKQMYIEMCYRISPYTFTDL